MNCPYCGREMEVGVIQSRDAVVWTKETVGGLFAPLRRKQSDGAVVLSEFHAFSGSAVRAYLCRECRKVLIDPTDGCGL